MKIVNLNTIDQGGSYKAAKRIHESLIAVGLQSSLLLRTKIDQANTGTEVVYTSLKKLASKTKNLGNIIFSRGELVTDEFGTDVTKLPEIIEADAIILHWCNSFIGYRQYKKIVSLGKPVVLVAHDMWPCTGGCHIDSYCGGFERGCVECPLLGESFMYRALARRNFLKKKEAFSGIAYVGVSNWSLENAKRSDIWSDSKKCCILNPIDYDIFKPCSVTKFDHLREHEDQKIILYGAVKTFSERNKGSDDFEEVMSKLPTEGYKIVVFGNKQGEMFPNCSLPVEYVGYIHSETDMAQLYSFADVYVNTSHQESFCYTVGEALACGTPVVAYGVGGIKDQVQHLVNGYLVGLDDIKGIAEGIEYCTGHEMHSIDIHNSLVETGNKYLAFIEGLM